MDPIPSFFFSYARNDRGPKLLRFFDDLKDRVAQAGGTVEEMGALDTDTVGMGENYNTKLGKWLGTCRAFVAMYTPTYFKRTDCGSELFVFLKRVPDLKRDALRRLVNVRNVLPVQWYPRAMYMRNAVNMAVVPDQLRYISYNPSNPTGDRKLARIIEAYGQDGMESFVGGGKSYLKLLTAIAATIVSEMQDLPPHDSATFDGAPNAFDENCDWNAEDGDDDGGAAAPAAGQTVEIGKKTVVAFYVTAKPYEVDPTPVGFARALIREPADNSAQSAKTSFDALLADVRTAGCSEGFDVFHAAADIADPAALERLKDDLRALCDAKAITVLVVDPACWIAPGTAAKAVDALALSGDWNGLLAVPTFDSGPQEAAILQKVKDAGIARTTIVLPQGSDERVRKLRSALLSVRSHIWQQGATQAPAPFPTLQGPGAGRN